MRLREEAAVRDRAARVRADELRTRLGAAASLLVAAGARRTWLFGSLAEGAPRIESDVDLAVEGVPRDRYFELLAALMELFGTRVDLVRMEDAPASLIERIRATGRAL